MKQLGPCSPGTHGTTVTFMPDQDIFPSIAWDRNILEERLRETAFLTQGLEISLYDLRRDPAGGATCPVTAWSRTFCFQNGLKDFVSWLEQDANPFIQESFPAAMRQIRCRRNLPLCTTPPTASSS